MGAKIDTFEPENMKKVLLLNDLSHSLADFLSGDLALKIAKKVILFF